MRATYMYGAGDVRVIDVPDPTITHPTDALVRVVRASICGSDLHPYHSMPTTPDGSSMGHEFLGTVEDTGRDVTTIRKGDLVIAPFAWSDGTCDFCREGLQRATSAAARPKRFVSRSPTAPSYPSRSPRTRRCCPRCSPSPTSTAPATTLPSKPM